MALGLVADMCVDFGLYDHVLWSNVMKQLRDAGCFEELRRVLFIIAGVPALWQLTGLTKIWRTVLNETVKRCANTSSCANAMALLVRCPNLVEVDAATIVDTLCDLRELRAAMVCTLGSGTDAEQLKQLDRIAQLSNPAALLDEVDQHEANIFSNSIRETVYGWIDQRGAYTSLAGTPHFPQMIHYLIVKDRIADVLRTTVEADRIDDAAKLVSTYCAHHQLVLEPASPREMLRDFAHRRNLETVETLLQ